MSEEPQKRSDNKPPQPPPKPPKLKNIHITESYSFFNESMLKKRKKKKGNN